MRIREERKWYLRIGTLYLMLILSVFVGSLYLKFKTPDLLVRPTLEVLASEQEKDNPDVIAYIKTIFGRDAKTATAVAKAECRGLYPYCRNKSSGEWSVCHFQINIKAHYNKIPGKDLGEKELWLIKDHKNCTMMARLIQLESGFWPWTTFRNKSYLKYL